MKIINEVIKMLMKINSSIEKLFFILICLCLCLCVKRKRIKDLSYAELMIAQFVPNPTFKNTIKYFVLYVLGIREYPKWIEKKEELKIKAATDEKAKKELEKINKREETDRAMHETIEKAVKRRIDNPNKRNRIHSSAIMTLSFKILKQAISEGFKVSVCNPIKKLEETISFQVVFSDKIFSADNWSELREIYHKASDNKRPLEDRTLLFSLFNDILRYTFMSVASSTSITSPGSKAGMCHLIDISKLGTFKTFVELCCRSCALSMYLGKFVERIILNDKDSKVTVYLRCLKREPYYLISYILKILSSEEFNKWMSGETSNKDYKKYVEAQMHLPMYKRRTINSGDFIKAAAYFYIYINMSFSGNEKMYRKYSSITSDTLNSTFSKMMSASCVLKKADVLNMDCKELVQNTKFDEETSVALDPPYIDENGDNDHTYDEQDVDSVYLDKLIESAAKNCEYLFVFHSDIPIANDIMAKNLNFMDSYISRKGIKTDNDDLRYYTTNIWSKGFSESFLRDSNCDPRINNNKTTNNSEGRGISHV